MKAKPFLELMKYYLKIKNSTKLKNTNKYLKFVLDLLIKNEDLELDELLDYLFTLSEVNLEEYVDEDFAFDIFTPKQIKKLDNYLSKCKEDILSEHETIDPYYILLVYFEKIFRNMLEDFFDFYMDDVSNIEEFQFIEESLNSVFKHYKGNYYLVLIDNAKLESNEEEMVVYKSLKDSQIWIRPKKQFFEKIDDNTFRFRKLVI